MMLEQPKLKLYVMFDSALMSPVVGILSLYAHLLSQLIALLQTHVPALFAHNESIRVTHSFAETWFTR